MRGEIFNINSRDHGIVRSLGTGITTRIFPGEKAMLSLVAIEPHACSAMHDHPQEQWGVLLEGDGERIQDGERIAVRAGDFWRTPAFVPHGFCAGPLGARVLDIFSPPRSEYLATSVESKFT